MQSRFGQNTCDASICSVLVSFIDTAYRSMLVFSTPLDFSSPVSPVLPQTFFSTDSSESVYISITTTSKYMFVCTPKNYPISLTFLQGFHKKCVPPFLSTLTANPLWR